MRRALIFLLLAGLSAFSIAQGADKSSAENASTSTEAAPQSSSAPASSSSSGSSPSSSSSPPPRPAPRAFKPSEEVRADTVLSLPADI